MPKIETHGQVPANNGLQTEKFLRCAIYIITE